VSFQVPAPQPSQPFTLADVGAEVARLFGNIVSPPAPTNMGFGDWTGHEWKLAVVAIVAGVFVGRTWGRR
jgi:hypothetical protein